MSGDELVLEVGTEAIKILLRDGGLTSNLRKGPKKTMDAAMLIARRNAPVCENYMKTNAPWTDRTGNARNGLAARAYQDGDEVGIVLYHQVDYGIWLEVRFNGRYAIIQPTIDEMGPRVMKDFERLLDRI